MFASGGRKSFAVEARFEERNDAGPSISNTRYSSLHSDLQYENNSAIARCLLRQHDSHQGSIEHQSLECYHAILIGRPLARRLTSPSIAVSVMNMG